MLHLLNKGDVGGEVADTESVVGVSRESSNVFLKFARTLQHSTLTLAPISNISDYDAITSFSSKAKPLRASLDSPWPIWYSWSLAYACRRAFIVSGISHSNLMRTG
eukprot:scaffold193391_cov32-Tisochrysis_lutea.AAC.4